MITLNEALKKLGQITLGFVGHTRQAALVNLMNAIKTAPPHEKEMFCEVVEAITIIYSAEQRTQVDALLRTFKLVPVAHKYAEPGNRGK